MNYDICSLNGKRMFATKGEALEVIRKSQSQRTYLGRRVKHRVTKRKEKRVFHCDHCDYFHLTSKEKFSNKKNNANKKEKLEGSGE